MNKVPYTLYIKVLLGYSYFHKACKRLELDIVGGWQRTHTVVADLHPIHAEEGLAQDAI